MTIDKAKELRIAWAAVKEGYATDDQFLLLVRQEPGVLDYLQTDYDQYTSPYRSEIEMTTSIEDATGQNSMEVLDGYGRTD